MSEECTHDCGSCGQDCGDRTQPQSLLAEANPESHVKKVIGVVSGKGGVGKSLVTSDRKGETISKGHSIVQCRKPVSCRSKRADMSQSRMKGAEST